MISLCKPNRAAGAWLPIIAVVAVFSVACGGPQTGQPAVAETDESPVSDTLDVRAAEVMAIHDEIMLQRGRLVRLQRKFAVQAPTLQNKLAQKRLERADSLMLAWMYADIPLPALRDSLSDANILQHLSTRQAAIQGVTDSMQASMQYAELILAQ